MLSRLRESPFFLPYSPQSWAGLVIILFGLFIQAQAQSSCFDPTITWWLNKNGEDPCLVLDRIMRRCSPSLPLFQPPDPRDTGCFPDPGFPDPQPCCCNPVTYSLEMACWTCEFGHKEPPPPLQRPRLEDYMRCPQRLETLPANLTSVDAPEWAFLPLELDEKWNYFVAEAFVTGVQPPSQPQPPQVPPPQSQTRPVSSQAPVPTARQSPSSSAGVVPSSNTPPSRTPGPRSPSATSLRANVSSGPNVALIAGVTAAGVICIVLVLLAVWLLLRRRRWLMKKSDSRWSGVAPSSFWSRSVMDRGNRRGSFSVYGGDGGEYGNGGGAATPEVRSIRPPPLVIQPIAIPPAHFTSNTASAFPDDEKTSAGGSAFDLTIADLRGNRVYSFATSGGARTAVPTTAATVMTASTYAHYPMPGTAPLSPGALTRVLSESRSNQSLANSSSTESSRIVFNRNPSDTTSPSSASGLGLAFSPTASTRTVALPRGGATASTSGHVPPTLHEEEQDAGVVLQMASPETSMRHIRPPPSYRDEWHPERF